MKKPISVLLALFILFLPSCTKDEEIVHAPPLDLPEVRIDYNYDLSFSELLPKIERVVRLRVKNWLSDSNVYERRCFEAEVISNENGDSGEKIVITVSYYGAELDYGDEIAVILRSTDGWIEEMRDKSDADDPTEIFPDFEHENAYEIVGGVFGLWRISESEGERSLVPELTESPLHRELLNYKSGKNYSYSDIIDYIESIK